LDIRKGKLLQEGRTKRLYATNRDDVALLVFKNETTAGDRKEPVKAKNLGKHACAVSGHVFRFLENYHVPTHFVAVPRPGEMAVRRMDMIPLTVWLWNAASGSLCKRYGFEKGRVFETPLLEWYWKNPALHGPMVQADHVQILGLARPEEVQEIDRLARKVNVVLKDFFARRGLRLADLTLEFGRRSGETALTLGDEVSPETCQLWDVDAGGNADPSRFQIGRRDADEVFEELNERIEGR
jgi:phosphoribosylaminoimidazole-succinocarboxamide synthase